MRMGSMRSMAMPSLSSHFKSSAPMNRGQARGGHGGFSGGYAMMSRSTAAPSPQAMMNQFTGIANAPAPRASMLSSASTRSGGFSGGETRAFTNFGPQVQQQTRGTTGGWGAGTFVDFSYDQAVEDEVEKFDAMGCKPIVKVDWSSKSAADKVLELILRQLFDGSWRDYDDTVSEIMGVEIPDAPEGVDDSAPGAWTTLLVINFLEQKMASEEGTWALVVDKARDWLAGLALANLEGLEQKASDIIKKQ